MFREKLTWSDFLDDYLCVPLDSVVLRSKIRQLSLVLQSGESIPPCWLSMLEFVVRLVRHPCCATRFSFVT